MTSPDLLSWLADWYSAACDGDWEHQSGLRIDTPDNPGWSVTTSLAGTTLEHSPFEAVSASEVGGDGSPGLRWHHCQVADQEFRAACGVFDLGTVIGLFGLALEKWRAPTEEPGGVLWETGTDRRRSFAVKRFVWR